MEVFFSVKMQKSERWVTITRALAIGDYLHNLKQEDIRVSGSSVEVYQVTVLQCNVSGVRDIQGKGRGS